MQYHKKLRILNLSCNHITKIENLDNLYSLEKLILAHNKISSLEGLQVLSKSNYNLNYIDLKNNNVKNYEELKYLERLTKLETIFFEKGKYTNPICQDTMIYCIKIQKLANFKFFKKIDGHTPEDFIYLSKEYRDKQA